MSNKTSLPTSRVHIMLYSEDHEYLTARYGNGGPQSDVGFSRAVREIVHQRVLGMRLRENQALDRLRDDQRTTGEEGVKLEP